MNLRILRIAILLSISIAVLTGCGGGRQPTSGTSTPVYREGISSQTLPGARALPGKPYSRFARPIPARRGKWSAPPPAQPDRSREELIALFRSDPSDPQTDGVLFDLARHEFAEKNFTRTIKTLQDLRKQFPLSPLYEESEFLLGLALQAAGKYNAAWLPLRGSLSRERRPQRRALLYAALGEVYEARQDHYAALNSYAEALSTSPAVEGAPLLLARILALARTKLATYQTQSAAKRFRKSPAGPILRLEFAHRAATENRPQTALAAVRQFLSDYPNHIDREPAEELETQLRKQLAVKTGKIGVLLPLSGPTAAAGEQIYQGVQLALRHALEKYPALRLELAVRDTRSTSQSPGIAAEKAAELIDDEGVISLIGPFWGIATEAAAIIADKKETPLLTPFSIRMQMSGSSPMVFRNSLTNRLQSQGIAVYAIQHLGIRRFAVLYPDDRDGKELARVFSEGVERLGGTVVKTVSFSPDANDFGVQMRSLGGLDDAQLRRKKIALGIPKNEPYEIELPFEALFVPAYHDKAVLIAPQVPFYNMRNIKLLGGRGWNSEKLIKYGEKYVEGAYFVDGFFADSEEPRVVQFVKEFSRLFGRKPDIFAALGYDAATMVFTGLAQGANNRESMQTYLSRLSGFEGIMGLTDMGPDGDTKRQLFVLSVKRKRIRHLQMVTPHRALDAATQAQSSDGAPVAGVPRSPR